MINNVQFQQKLYKGMGGYLSQLLCLPLVFGKLLKQCFSFQNVLLESLSDYALSAKEMFMSLFPLLKINTFHSTRTSPCVACEQHEILYYCDDISEGMGVDKTWPESSLSDQAVKTTYMEKKKCYQHCGAYFLYPFIKRLFVVLFFFSKRCQIQSISSF